MPTDKQPVTIDQISEIILECLRVGRRVEIDGIGVFRNNNAGCFRFQPQSTPRIFLAYVDEDADQVLALYDILESVGLSPWMDKKKLLAGQNWPRAIDNAIRSADLFVPCFSKRASEKRGRFQSELRVALKCAQLHPLDSTFIVPVRLEECAVPAAIAEHIQFIDLFPKVGKGVKRLVEALWEAGNLRRRNPGL